MILGRSNLGQDVETGKIVNDVVSTGSKLVTTFGGDFLAEGAIPVIGFVTAWFTSLLGAIFSIHLDPKLARYSLGIAIPKDQYPTVGACILAATNFVATSTAVPTPKNYGDYGAIILTEGGKAYGASESSHQIVARTVGAIQEYQQRVLTPFFSSILNLTPQRKAAIINDTLTPPLRFGAPYGDFSDVPSGFQIAILYNGEGFSGALSDVVKQGYQRFLDALDAVFLRRLHISILNNPIVTTEIPGDVNEPTYIEAVPITSENNPFGFVAPIKGSLVQTSYGLVPVGVNETPDMTPAAIQTQQPPVDSSSGLLYLGIGIALYALLFKR